MNSVTTSKRRWLCVSVCGAVVCGFRRGSNFQFSILWRIFSFFFFWHTRQTAVHLVIFQVCVGGILWHREYDARVKGCMWDSCNWTPWTQRYLKKCRHFQVFKIIMEEWRVINEVSNIVESVRLPSPKMKCFWELLGRKPTLALLHFTEFNRLKATKVQSRTYRNKTFFP